MRGHSLFPSAPGIKAGASIADCTANSKAWALLPASILGKRPAKQGPLALGITPDLHHCLGARLNHTKHLEKWEQLLEMALGVFNASGIVRLRLHREADVATVGDLLVYSLEEWEALAEQKGGIRRLLDEKWAKVYQAKAPRGLFTHGELHVSTCAA